MSEYILETKNLTKSYAGVVALKNVDFKIRRGEIHALVGENGAGKSTLIHTLMGAIAPDCGEIILNGEKVVFDSPVAATNHGISAVFQELSVVDNLSIAENIFINRHPLKFGNQIDFNKLHENTLKLLKLFDIEHIDPKTPVGKLSVANKQLVEILKAISYDPKILILDEPTSSLTEVEVRNLFKNIRRLNALGVSFLYISHHLKEIFEIADTLTVFRDGEWVCDAKVADVDEKFLISKMVGREIVNIFGKRESAIGDTCIDVRNISRAGSFLNISFTIKRGEILGFAGLVGAGRTEVGRAIFGAEPIDDGEIRINGKTIKIDNIQDAIRNGIGYVTEDRKQLGLFLNHSLKANVVSNKLKKITKHLSVIESRINDIANAAVKNFGIMATSIEQKVISLSGGNQQKVLLSEWFDIQPTLLIIDEPTRGVDIGAKSDIYERIRRLAKQNVCIMLISSDLLEILGMSDRIIVLKNGQMAGELAIAEASEEVVLSKAIGVAQ